MEHRVFERMDVFSTKYGHESEMFLENRRFFTKYGHESSDFFVKNRKTKTSYLLFWPIIWCSFHRIYIFLPKYGYDSRGFSWQIWKKWYENTVFWRIDIFDKIWTWDQCVFREWTFCWQNMCITTLIFSCEIRKNGHPIDFFGP